MQLFGPVLFYDVIRMSRRGRYIVLRCLYVTLLLAILWYLYRTHFDSPSMPIGPSYAKMQRMPYVNQLEASAQQLALFAEHFFGVFMAVQFALIVLVTPAMTAGAIAEEKQRRTLEYILATDLANREIVLGKLFARLGTLTLFLLAGLPVISLMLFLGGIDPVLLFAGFGATVLTMVSIAGLSIFNSVYARRPRDAIVRTYLMIAGYPALWAILLMLQGVMTLPPPAPKYVLNFMDGLLSIFNAGNVFWAIYALYREVNTSGSTGTLPQWLFLKYVVFHLFVAVLCTWLAVRRVRAVYVRQTFGGEKRRKKQPAPPTPNEDRQPADEGWGPFGQPAAANGAAEGVAVGASVRASSPKRPRKPRPPVGEAPMLWKERYVERGFRLGMIGEGAFALVALACLFPALVMVGVVLLDAFSSGGSVSTFQQGMAGYVRFLGTALACLVLLAIGIRAAGSIGSERDKQTFDGLMASTLTNVEILWAKWRGSVAAPRWMYWMLGLVLFLAGATLSLHWSSFLLWLITLVIFVVFTASLGLYFATATKTGLRAVSVFALAFLILAIGPPLVASTFFGDAPDRLDYAGPGFQPSHPLRSIGFDFGRLVRGFSPPYVLYRFAYHWNDIEPSAGSEYPVRFASSYDDRFRARSRFVSEVVSCLAGVAVYGVLAIVLWYRARDRFRVNCGRVRSRPERRRMPVRAA